MIALIAASTSIKFSFVYLGMLNVYEIWPSFIPYSALRVSPTPHIYPEHFSEIVTSVLLHISNSSFVNSGATALAYDALVAMHSNSVDSDLLIKCFMKHISYISCYLYQAVYRCGQHFLSVKNS